VTLAPSLPLQELVRLLRRRRGLIAITAMLGTALVCAGALLIPPRYTAKSQIVVEPHPTGLAGSSAVVIAQPEDEGAVLTEVTKISSHDHLQRVLTSLANDPNAPASAAEHRFGQFAIGDGLWQVLRTWLPTSWFETNKAQPPMLAAFERRLNIYQERGSHVIAVTFTSTNPTEAATAANRVAELYVKSQGEQKRAYASRVLAWLDERIPELKREVERLESEIQAYQTTHGLSGINRTNVSDQNLAELNRQLTNAQSDLSVRQQRLASLRDQRLRGVGADALIGTPEPPALAELRRRELTLLQLQADIAATLGEKHPKMQQIRSQLQEVRGKISREAEQAVGSLTNDVQIGGEEVRTLQQRVAVAQGASTDPHLQELERDAVSDRRLYESLQQRREELREQRELISPGVAMLSLAPPPQRPSSPDPLLFVPPAFIVSLVCGCFLTIFLERLDGNLRNEHDIQNTLGIPCIGLVPRLRRIGRRRPHQYLMMQPFAPYTEGIRSIVAALGLVEPRPAPKVILISSSMPNEGKTTLAVSIAVYTALLGRRVILVDLDFRHPATMREFTGKAGSVNPGLLPQGHVGSDPIQRFDGLDLDYLQVPRDTADPLTRFASDHMERLLHRLRTIYDCVIIDSAPVLAITETRLLAAMVDKVLFVVKWGATRREIAQNALNLLCSSGNLEHWRSVVAGAVITQVDLRKHARYRYGDIGECLLQYGKSYVAPSRLPAPPAQTEGLSRRVRNEDRTQEWPV
jgi:polysaccharide biosynthesis transport protein